MVMLQKAYKDWQKNTGMAVVQAACGMLPLVGAAAAQQDLAVAVGDFCTQLTDILPIIAMLMIVFGGVVYAGGQIAGSETRARASQWATAMLLGAVIGILIATVAPAVISTMYGCRISCGGAFIPGGGLAPC